MTTNRRIAKKQHKENGSVKTAELTPTFHVGVEGKAILESSPLPGEHVHPLMAEVESFLSRRDELARKLAEEIVSTEKKLAELKKIAASLFPERASNEPVDRKSKKHKDKSSNREAKNDLPGSAENTQSADSES